jgi:hypothetical protein
MPERKTTIGRKSAPAALLLAFAIMAVAGGAPTARSADPDWPCVQRLVPELSAATVWDGPDFVSFLTSWGDRPVVHRLVTRVASRRTDLEQAEKAITIFADGLDADKDATLTAAFAGIFSIIDDDRSQLIVGIKRYAQNQQRLAARIRDARGEMEVLTAKSIPESDARLQQLHEQLSWDTRIHRDREKSLTAMCEQPVLLEQRLFVLTRAIRAAMTR